MVNVKLVPMTVDEYEIWSPRQTAEYAMDKVKAGDWPEEGSLERARREVNELLPKGVATPDHHIFTVRDHITNQRVGYLWVRVTMAATGKVAFIFDIEMERNLRGQGYGAATLSEMEQWLVKEGVGQVGLHVFAYNSIAQRLYERMGFHVTGINMSKNLSQLER